MKRKAYLNFILSVIMAALTILPMNACTNGTGKKDVSDPTFAPTEDITPATAFAPTEERTPEPTASPTEERTPEPTASPTEERTPEPTAEPTSAPTATPAPTRELTPTPKPTPTPTPKPTQTPTPKPTPTPTPKPTPTREPEVDYSYIERAVSPVDFNENGIDDYTDFLYGAKLDALNHPVYDPSYQKNGYPPDNRGVCSDVIWRAFRQAGYSLRYMVDKDIRDNTWRYPQVYSGKEKRDDKIDFRRVRNLRIFFDEYAIKLTTDITKIEEWQPGDIVIFNKNTHIGIVSDKRNSKGIPYIIHNGGQAEREEDYLEGDHTVAAHFRFDASRVPAEMLIPWEG